MSTSVYVVHNNPLYRTIETGRVFCNWVVRHQILIFIVTLISLNGYYSEPILEEEPSLRGLGSGSITHGNEMSFQDFADLFKIFR